MAAHGIGRPTGREAELGDPQARPADASASNGESGDPPGRRAAERPSRPFIAQAGIGAAQSAIYVVVAALLLVAAGFTAVGSVLDVVEGSKSRPISDTGLFLLDRVLLLFIIAELLYTLRLIDVGGRILVEPFLYIGLIAIVRRILVLAAEVESGNDALTDFLLEVAGLAGLALVLTLSIYLLRRSARPQPEPGER